MSGEIRNQTSRMPRLMQAIAFIAIAGVMVSSVSLQHHFSHSKTSFCNLSETFNCDIVNRSIYSTLFGIPVALLGILGYLFILALATIYRQKAETPIVLLITSAGGLGFALYLTYIEKFVLLAWCILCLSSLALIFTATALSGVLVATSIRNQR